MAMVWMRSLRSFCASKGGPEEVNLSSSAMPGCPPPEFKIIASKHPNHSRLCYNHTGHKYPPRFTPQRRTVEQTEKVERGRERERVEIGAQSHYTH